MKSILTITALLLSLHAMAQGAPRKMEFWDGTFAYNKLNVSEDRFEGNLLRVKLSGSQLGLTSQIEGVQDQWGVDDGFDIFIRKSDCAVDFIKKTLSCSVEKVSVNNLTWHVNHRVSKVFKGLVNNLKIEANSKGVDVEFSLESDEFFTPHQEDIKVGFSNLPFNL